MKSLIPATAFIMTLASTIFASPATSNSPNTPISSGPPHFVQVPQIQSPRSQDSPTPAQNTAPRPQNTLSTEKSPKDGVSGSRTDNYPAYCSPLPPGVTKDD